MNTISTTNGARAATALLDSQTGLPLERIATKGDYIYAHGSASAQVKAGPGEVHSVSFSAITDAVVDVYDNTGATGNKIRTLRVAAGVTVGLTVDAAFATGLYVNIVSGTGEFGVSYR